jgi:hypothetical protein
MKSANSLDDTNRAENEYLLYNAGYKVWIRQSHPLKQVWDMWLLFAVIFTVSFDVHYLYLVVLLLILFKLYVYVYTCLNHSSL